MLGSASGWSICPTSRASAAQSVQQGLAEIEVLKTRQQVIEERIKELGRGSKWLKQGDVGVAPLPVGADREGEAERAGLAGPLPLAPARIDRYLPHDGFRNLLLLLGLVIVGRGASRGSSCSSRKSWSPTSCS